MQFAYTAKSPSGESCAGLLEADGLAQARAQLREQRLLVVSLKEAALARRAANGPRRRGKVTARDLFGMTTQLAIMTRSGIDLAGALKSLAEQTRKPLLKQALQDVLDDVTGGKSVSQAFRRHERIFGDAYISSVAAGEAAGRLPDVLARLAQLQRTSLRNRAMVRTLLAYPLVLTVVSTSVVCALVGFVLPQFAEVFAEVDVPLPALTQVVLSIADGIRGFAWLWLPLLLAAGVGLLAYVRTTAGRRWRHGLLLNIPLTSEVARNLLIGRSFRLLGIMLESGVPLLEAVRLTRNSSGNLHFQELFHRLEVDILNGRGLGLALADSDFVPPSAAEMVMTAEKTGTLADVAQLMGDHYEEEGETKLRDLATILEPAIVIGMGVMVAVLVLAVMLPMFDMATLAR